MTYRVIQWATGNVGKHAVKGISEHKNLELAGHVDAGTVGAQRWKWSGIANGTSRIEHETVWRIHKDLAPDWPQSENVVSIIGQPTMKIDFGEGWINDGLLATAMHAVNAIPAVCESAPGIQTLLDLPIIFGRGSFH